MAKITWNFDGTDTIDAGNTSPFSFKLERYKDSNTFEESLKISSFVNGADNGFIKPLAKLSKAVKITDTSD